MTKLGKKPKLKKAYLKLSNLARNAGKFGVKSFNRAEAYESEKNPLKETFGILKLKKSTSKILDEIDKNA